MNEEKSDILALNTDFFLKKKKGHMTESLRIAAEAGKDKVTLPEDS